MSISAIDGRAEIRLEGPQIHVGSWWGAYPSGQTWYVNDDLTVDWPTEFLGARTSWPRYSLYHESGGWTPFTATTPGYGFGGPGPVTYRTTLSAEGILTLEAITSPPWDELYGATVYRTMKETYDLEDLTYTFEYDYSRFQGGGWSVDRGKIEEKISLSWVSGSFGFTAGADDYPGNDAQFPASMGIWDSALDNDFDGLTNLQEYLAGTDHEYPNLNLKFAQITVGTNVTLTFHAIADKTYSVLYKTALSEANWSKLTDVVASPTNGMKTVIAPLGSSATRFYQLTTPALP